MNIVLVGSDFLHFRVYAEDVTSVMFNAVKIITCVMYKCT